MSDRERRRWGFASRLLSAQALVLVAGAVTTWVVASFVGPSIFRDHLQQAGVSHTSVEARHVVEAFSSALLISLSVALLAATITALVVTWYLTRRVRQSIGQVAAAASEVAAGSYEDRVADPGLGVEFATLADSYNSLAQRLGKVEAIRRRMLADLAHEMRTPLATVEAHLEAVEDGVRSLDEDTLRVIRLSTRRLGRLAEDIAAVSQAEEGTLDIHRHRVPANTLAAAAAEGARDRFVAKGVRLDTHLGSNDPVLADPDRIGQVLGNLLDNALRHAPTDAGVTLSCRRNGRWVEFIVADSGEGIAPEHLSHVFDRFYRVDTARDRDRGGSGIGLSISKALVEAHGGTLTAHSEGSGHGATFTVRLARAERRPARVHD